MVDPTLPLPACRVTVPVFTTRASPPSTAVVGAAGLAGCAWGTDGAPVVVVDPLPTEVRPLNACPCGAAAAGVSAPEVPPASMPPGADFSPTADDALSEELGCAVDPPPSWPMPRATTRSAAAAV